MTGLSQIIYSTRAVRAIKASDTQSQRAGEMASTPTIYIKFSTQDVLLRTFLPLTSLRTLSTAAKDSHPSIDTEILTR